ncbi:protein-PII uridylyltransferase [Bifidobacterium aquikefiricola]|uniref:Nucleotidyltransferase domain-containing protein n=1 Tax=Bifidobacterium aquikefiricola TaxID=3059038 RepID=A0AB39U7H9_9BIFI
MIAAVQGLHDKLVAMSQPDSDGVYRQGSVKRAQRSEFVVNALSTLWQYASDELPFDIPETGVGLAAVGSLARKQLGPSSDLDLVLIVDSHSLNDEQISQLADKLWYPLWDSGLDLDHSVRTRAQCESVTDHDLPAAMGWLNVLPIAGDTDLIADIASSILDRWRKAARKRLPELVESATARLDRFGRLAYINQPDIKEARGGLRDAVLVSALTATWLADRPHGRYDAAVDRLLDVRDSIHLIANRDTDMLLHQYQPKVAQMLGLTDPTLPEESRNVVAIDDLQTLLASLGRRIAFSLDMTSSNAQHSLIHEKPRFTFFRGRRGAPRFDVVAHGVATHEQEIVLAIGENPARDRSIALRVAVAAAEFDLPISVATLLNIRRSPIQDHAWTEEERELFVRLLASGPTLLRIWEEIDYVDIPGRLVPEWLGVRNRPSASDAHRYTIDRHMVEVASRLDRQTHSGGRYDDDHYAALLLAGIFHDIGKRQGILDHSVEGARHVPIILSRIGYAQNIVDMATLLVREHLTLSQYATTKNPHDSAVIEDLANRIHRDPVLLDMLYDLTKADGSSLGATANEAITKRYGWSSWRASIVENMYQAVRRMIVQAQPSA